MQAKHHATNVSIDRPDIQAFVGSLVEHESSKGVFVNTSFFSTLNCPGDGLRLPSEPARYFA